MNYGPLIIAFTDNHDWALPLPDLPFSLPLARL
jgi:hypothetical protein